MFSRERSIRASWERGQNQLVGQVGVPSRIWVPHPNDVADLAPHGGFAQQGRPWGARRWSHFV